MPYTPPHSIGHYPSHTSTAAAARMGAGALTIRDQVIDCLKRSTVPLTADEIAQRIGRHYGSVRPRLTELKRSGEVRDSGTRKTGSWGIQHTAWELVKPEGGDA